MNLLIEFFNTIPCFFLGSPQCPMANNAEAVDFIFDKLWPAWRSEPRPCLSRGKSVDLPRTFTMTKESTLW